MGTDSFLLNFYFLLPYNLKCMVSSLYGFYLNYMRYNSEIEKLVEEAHEREYWPYDKIKEYQIKELREILKNHKYVPYLNFEPYKEFLKKIEKGELSLETLPILEKKDLKKNLKNYISSKRSLLFTQKVYTSGTTGTPLKLYRDRTANIKWYAFFEARWRRWYGVSKRNRWAIIGGKNVVSVKVDKPPFWVWNHPMNQLYISAYHISPKNSASMVEAIRKYKIEYLVGYASALEFISRHIIEQNLEPPDLKIIISNAEPLYDYQKELIQKAFRCRVVDTYGMAEIVVGASECEYGKLHIWEDCGIVEVLDKNNREVETGKKGNLICTGLLNKVMPLLRYKTGDTIILDREPCKCGRTFKTIQKIEGREDDVVITPSGREIGRLDTVFKADLPILRAQIIQEDITTLRVLIIPTKVLFKENKFLIEKLLREKVGDEFNIIIEEVEEIPLTSGGKYKMVVSKLSNKNNR